jgi:hypothetical protein
MRVLDTSNDGVAFANINANKSSSLSTLTNGDSGGARGKWDKKAHIACHKCGIQGHYTSKCPELKQKSGVQMLMAGVVDDAFDQATPFQFLLTTGVVSQATTFHQQQNGWVPTSWTLLDNQSTVNVFSNKALLTNIRATDREYFVL